MDGQGYATALGLSTAVGLRPFVILAVSAMLMHFGVIHPSHAFAWMGATGVTDVFIALAVVELLADKIPVVDHVLHTSHLAIAPIAAALVAGAALPNGTPDGSAYTVMGLGALNALGVRTASSSVRVASTGLTFGVANPVLSFIEDICTALLALAAFLVPIVAIAAGVLCLVAAVLFVRSGRGLWGRALRKKSAVHARGSTGSP